MREEDRTRDLNKQGSGGDQSQVDDMTTLSLSMDSSSDDNHYHGGMTGPSRSSPCLISLMVLVPLRTEYHHSPKTNQQFVLALSAQAQGHHKGLEHLIPMPDIAPAPTLLPAPGIHTFVP